MATLWTRAADCYERAGCFAEAARCQLRAGVPSAAARLFEQAGDLAEAIRCHLRSGRLDLAAGCHLRAGQVAEAARCLEQAGDRLTAAWVLLTADRQHRRPLQAWRLLEHPARNEAQKLLAQLARGVCSGQLGRGDAAAAEALATVEGRLVHLTPVAERPRVREWAVRTAELIDRPDLAARVFAASYRAGVPGAADRWQDWARDNLGGTAGVPDDPVAVEDTAGTDPVPPAGVVI